jgi:hypothetical protein
MRLRMPADDREVHLAERRVVDAEHLVARQRELIDRLLERGYPTDRAECVLARLEKSLAKHRDYLNRLLGSC